MIEQASIEEALGDNGWQRRLEHQWKYMYSSVWTLDKVMQE